MTYLDARGRHARFHVTRDISLWLSPDFFRGAGPWNPALGHLLPQRVTAGPMVLYSTVPLGTVWDCRPPAHSATMHGLRQTPADLSSHSQPSRSAAVTVGTLRILTNAAACSTQELATRGAPPHRTPRASPFSASPGLPLPRLPSPPF